MSEEKSFKEILAELSQDIKDMKEVKKKTGTSKWNLPFAARVGMGKKKKRMGYVVFMNVGENKAVTFIKAPVEDGVAMVNGIPHPVNPEDILIWKNRIPMCIIPQWSEKPFSPKEHYRETIANNQNTMGWQYIINYINKNQITNKKPVPTGFIIIGVLAVIGLGYYLIKSGALS
jgi:hypothetical protein